MKWEGKCIIMALEDFVLVVINHHNSLLHNANKTYMLKILNPFS